jgi:hypothetical protein
MLDIAVGVLQIGIFFAVGAAMIALSREFWIP